MRHRIAGWCAGQSLDAQKNVEDVICSRRNCSEYYPASAQDTVSLVGGPWGLALLQELSPWPLGSNLAYSVPFVLNPRPPEKHGKNRNKSFPWISFWKLFIKWLKLFIKWPRLFTKQLLKLFIQQSPGIRFPRRQFVKNCQTWGLFRTAAGQVFPNFSGTLPPEPYECSGLDIHAICCPCGPLVDVGGLVSSYTPLGSNLLLPITNCDRATE